MSALAQVEQNQTLPGLKKMNRHVTVAINHINKRRETLLAQRAKVNQELEELDAALLALE